MNNWYIQEHKIDDMRVMNNWYIQEHKFDDMRVLKRLSSIGPVTYH